MSTDTHSRDQVLQALGRLLIGDWTPNTLLKMRESDSIDANYEVTCRANNEGSALAASRHNVGFIIHKLQGVDLRYHVISDQ